MLTNGCARRRRAARARTPSPAVVGVSFADESGPLGRAPRGFRGSVHRIEVAGDLSGLPEGELERRLIELGFLEGASVEILHEGIFGRDPIAVRIDHATVALRRREAMAILVTERRAK